MFLSKVQAESNALGVNHPDYQVRYERRIFKDAGPKHSFGLLAHCGVPSERLH
jgi:hypothetical protein